MCHVSVYNKHDKQLLKTAAEPLNSKNNRVQEIISYAKEARLLTIGIAYCTSFKKEAEELEKILNAEGVFYYNAFTHTLAPISRLRYM